MAMEAERRPTGSTARVPGAREEQDRREEGRPAVSPIATEASNPSGVPGDTNVSDEVIAAIAGHAAGQQAGVSRLGSGGMIRSMTDAATSTASAKGRGVKVQAGRREAIFDIDMVVQHGHRIPDVVENIRRSVASEVKEKVGLSSKEININVLGIDFPDEEQGRPSRVE